MGTHIEVDRLPGQVCKVISSLGGPVPVPRTSGGRDEVEELVEDDLSGLDELHVVPADSEDVIPDLDGEGALLLGGVIKL